MTRLLLFIVLVVFGITSRAQNPRLSMFDASPLHLNPAYAGKFDGKFRALAHVSSQSADSAKNSHATIAFDYNSKWDVNKPAPRKYLGFGFQHYRYGDMGNSPISASFTSLSGAYHTLLDKRGRHYFGAGAQAIFASGKLDRSKPYVYEKEISGGGFRFRESDTDTPFASHSYVDFAVGVYYGYKTPQFRFEAGLSMYHLFYPKNDIFQLDPDQPSLRHRGVFSMKFDFNLNDTRNIAFKSVYWADGLYWLSRQFDSDNLIAFWNGIELTRNYNIDKKYYFNYGLFTRNFRTVMPQVSIFYNRSYNLRLSYETPINSTKFSAYNAKRAELALIMILDMRGKLLPYIED